jgi:thioredoxin-like negative regulator of GroEL/uncharacterized integral membrane protein
MRYWLTATAAVALTIAGGWFVVLNQEAVSVHATPSDTWVVPLGAALLGAFLLGCAVVGLLTVGGAVSRRWGARRARRRVRVQTRGLEALERGRDQVQAWELSKARATLLAVPEHTVPTVERIALLAETYLRDGDPATARAVLTGAPPGTADDPRLLDLGARAAEALGDRAAAIGALERARRAAPSSPWLAARLRDLYAAEGRWQDAANLETELWLGPSPLAGGRDTLRGFRYEAAMSEPDPGRAVTSLRTLAEESPDFLPAWVSAGDRLVEDGRGAAARRVWLRGLRHRRAAALLERIETFDAAAGEQERTVRLFEKLRARHPGDTTLALHSAKLLVDEGRLDEADAVLAGMPAEASLVLGLRGASARGRGDAAAAADSFARALGADLGLTGSWRCGPCSATAPEWSGRCRACGRWNTLVAPPESVTASDVLIQDTKRSQPGPR